MSSLTIESLTKESLTKKSLIKEILNEFNAEALIEKNEIYDLYHELNHILSLNIDLKEIGLKEIGFEESDFDEINDMLFNKINYLLNNNYKSINQELLTEFKLKITEDELKEKITEDELKEKILRIVIVLLHEQKKDENQKIIKAICENLLENLDNNLIEVIKKFYVFTTGKELNI